MHWVISVQDTGRTDESHRPAARREMYGIEQKTRVRETACVRENRTSAETQRERERAEITSHATGQTQTHVGLHRHRHTQTHTDIHTE